MGAPLVFVLHGYFGTAAGMYDISGFGNWRTRRDLEWFGLRARLMVPETTIGMPILTGVQRRTLSFCVQLADICRPTSIILLHAPTAAAIQTVVT